MVVSGLLGILSCLAIGCSGSPVPAISSGGSGGTSATGGTFAGGMTAASGAGGSLIGGTSAATSGTSSTGTGGAIAGTGGTSSTGDGGSSAESSGGDGERSSTSTGGSDAGIDGGSRCPWITQPDLDDDATVLVNLCGRQSDCRRRERFGAVHWQRCGAALWADWRNTLLQCPLLPKLAAHG